MTKKGKPKNYMAYNFKNSSNYTDYLNSYNENKDKIIKGMFLHMYTSPYDENRSEYNENLLKNTKVTIEKINNIINSESNIKKLQMLEKEKMVNMYVQLRAYLENNGEITVNELQQYAQSFLDLSDFNKQLRALNYMYYLYLTHKDSAGSVLLSDTEKGRINWLGIQESLGGKIRETVDKKGKKTTERDLSYYEKEWFDAWYKIFSPDVTIGKGFPRKLINLRIKKEELELLLNKFEEFENILQGEIDIYKKNNNFLEAEMLSLIQNYTLGRGINFISSAIKNIGINTNNYFEEAKNIISKNTNNNRLKEKIINTSQPKNIHYDYKSIIGSFKHSISSSNLRGFSAEDLVKDSFNNFSIKITDRGTEIKWGSTRAGGILNEANKMQKTDNVFEVPQLINITNRKGKEISQINKKENRLIINLSLKDYRDDDISIHLGGNLESITAYLETNFNKVTNQELMNEAKQYLEKLNSSIFKYSLLNEGEPHRITLSRNDGLFKNLSNQLSSLGSVFALSKVVSANNLYTNNDGVDFLVINQVIIPGSKILAAINKVIYRTTISPGSYPTNPDYTPEEIKNSNELYSDEVIDKYKARNINLFKKITFSFHLQKKFKNILIEEISNYEGG